MVTAAGGVVTTDVDDKLDYLAIGHRRGDKKIATVNKAKKLIDAGATDHAARRGRVSRSRAARQAGERERRARLRRASSASSTATSTRRSSAARSTCCARIASSCYTKLDGEHLVGVVRSQSGSGNVYASWLGFDGHYGCAQPDLEDCMGLQGAMLQAPDGARRRPRAHRPDDAGAGAAVDGSDRNGKGPRKNDELCAETFIQYKGAEAGEVDWRPTETIPEDFYAV